MTICCSFVPANCPRIAWVMAVGGCSVKLYINIDEVVAIVLQVHKNLVRLQRTCKLCADRCHL